MIPILLFAAAAAACHPVAGDRIFGSDLAAASPPFAAIAPETVIGNAPLPGARRFFEVGELVRIAQANHLDSSAIVPLCLERETAPLDAASVMAAMRKSLGL